MNEWKQYLRSGLAMCQLQMNSDLQIYDDAKKATGVNLLECGTRGLELPSAQTECNFFLVNTALY